MYDFDNVFCNGFWTNFERLYLFSKCFWVTFFVFGWLLKRWYLKEESGKIQVALRSFLSFELFKLQRKSSFVVKFLDWHYFSILAESVIASDLKTLKRRLITQRAFDWVVFPHPEPCLIRFWLKKNLLQLSKDINHKFKVKTRSLNWRNFSFLAVFELYFHQ